MEELIVDDIPIFTRVHKKCLLFCSISVLRKHAKGLCLINWFAAILKISKMRSVAMQTKCKPNQPVVVLVELLFIYMIYVRWLKWWCGWECACLLEQKFSNTRPPNPLAQVQWYSYRACAFEWCAKFRKTQFPTKCFTSPMPKAAQLSKDEMRKRSVE